MVMVFQTIATKVSHLSQSEQKRLYTLQNRIKYENPDIVLSLLYRFSQRHPELSDEQLQRMVQYRIDELLEDSDEE